MASNRTTDRTLVTIRWLLISIVVTASSSPWNEIQVNALSISSQYQCRSIQQQIRKSFSGVDRRWTHQQPMYLARRPDYDDDDDDDDFYSSEFPPRSSNVNRRQQQQQQPRSRRIFNDFNDEDAPTMLDDLGRYDRSSGLGLPSSFGRRAGWRLPDSVSKALLAGVFVLGVGLGVTIDSQVNTNPKDLASRDAIDQAAPNSVLCAKLGASAMAFDQRVFVSFNPFNVYVTQADVKPACVLREANIVAVLKSRGLINDEEVRNCKEHLNTWAFVGDLDDTPQLSCVYKSQDAQNEFLSNPKIGIGEDYLDDDRQRLLEKASSGKLVKSSLTEAQKDLLRKELAVATDSSI